MSEIVILDKFPIVLTKEVWQPEDVAKEGAIIVLPQDAVLVVASTTDLKGKKS